MNEWAHLKPAVTQAHVRKLRLPEELGGNGHQSGAASKVEQEHDGDVDGLPRRSIGCRTTGGLGNPHSTLC